VKILIIRFSSLGDIVLTTPILSFLKKEYSSSVIHYVTKESFREILEENSNLDKVFLLKKQSLFQLAKETKNYDSLPYDLVFDLHNSLRSKLFSMLIKAKKNYNYKKPYLKRWMLVYMKINLFKKINEIPYLYIQNYKRGNNQKIKLNRPQIIPVALDKKKKLGWNDKKKTIAISAGARWFTKRWPVKNFINVISKIISENPRLQIVLLGGKEEIETSKLIVKSIKNKNLFDFTGKLSIRESAYLLSKSDLFLTNDSGLMHVASAFDIKIVALFLSTVVEFGFQPFTKNKIILSEKIKCKPCDHKGLPKCPKKHFQCAYLITVEKVFNILKETIK